MAAQSRLFYILSTRTHDFMDRSWFWYCLSTKTCVFVDRGGTKHTERALWRSSRSLLWGAGWRIRQLRCPALRKDLSQSEDKERYIPDTSELRSERLYFRIERLCRCIRRTIIKVVKYRLIVVHERLQNSVKALQLHLVYSIIPPCQFSHLRSAFRAQCIQSILSNCKRTAKAAVNVERSFEMPFQPPVKDSDTNPFNFQNNSLIPGSSPLNSDNFQNNTHFLGSLCQMTPYAQGHSHNSKRLV